MIVRNNISVKSISAVRCWDLDRFADICQQIQIPVNSTKTDIRKILFNMQINSVGSGMLFC